MRARLISGTRLIRSSWNFHCWIPSEKSLRNTHLDYSTQFFIRRWFLAIGLCDTWTPPWHAYVVVDYTGYITSFVIWDVFPYHQSGWIVTRHSKLIFLYYAYGPLGGWHAMYLDIYVFHVIMYYWHCTSLGKGCLALLGPYYPFLAYISLLRHESCV